MKATALNEQLESVSHVHADLHPSILAHIGDVMLFKGESWQDSMVEPIVHRSPEYPSHQRRLLLTLDMI